MLAAKRSRLPAAYQEVEWLETTRSQYIKVPLVNIPSIVHIKGKFEFTTLSMPAHNYWNDIVGVPYMSFGYNQNLGGIYLLNYSFNNGCIKFANISTNTLYDFDICQNQRNFTAVLNGDSKTGATTTTSFNEAAFYVGAANNNNITCSIARLHEFYYYESVDESDLKHHVIPCYRKSDQKPGFYDTCTSSFYVNAGTGEFLVGPDVN